MADSNPELPDISEIIVPEKYSSSYRLFQVTTLVLRFIRCLRDNVSSRPAESHVPVETTLSTNDIEQAHVLWVYKNVQTRLQKDKKLSQWKRQLGLYIDSSGLWRFPYSCSTEPHPVVQGSPTDKVTCAGRTSPCLT